MQVLREQSDDDHVGNALLLEAEIQVGIGKAAANPNAPER